MLQFTAEKSVLIFECEKVAYFYTFQLHKAQILTKLTASEVQTLIIFSSTVFMWFHL